MPDRGLARKLHKLLHQALAVCILGVGFTRHNQLHRTLRMGQDMRETCGIVEQQVGPFVGRKASGEPQGQHVGIEDSLGRLNQMRVGASLTLLLRQMLAHATHQRLPPPGTKRP